MSQEVKFVQDIADRWIVIECRDAQEKQRIMEAIRCPAETTAYDARGDHIKELMSVLGELWRWHEHYENVAPPELAEKVTKALRVEKT
jgi:hypothetical protein